MPPPLPRPLPYTCPHCTCPCSRLNPSPWGACCDDCEALLTAPPSSLDFTPPRILSFTDAGLSPHLDSMEDPNAH